jgi:hypothetical protein
LIYPARFVIPPAVAHHSSHYRFISDAQEVGMVVCSEVFFVFNYRNSNPAGHGIIQKAIGTSAI